MKFLFLVLCETIMSPEVERLGLIARKTGYFEVLDSGYVPFRGENMGSITPTSIKEKQIIFVQTSPC